ncbi:tudor domain-containing 6 [Colossoma macropomum]|uniref:tudor domain-containing 6 n=1 Tax=Colossoma macropomum TaxID=42526 RepID=UPI001864A810|nr:tudor domain-containing 6 [Colossoma macropomum]
MCSRHVLPTVGSNVTVHITRVNLQPHCAFVEFGGNFNHGQLMREIYQQMKKEIQIHKERDCDFEGDPGDVCLVEEEKIWHRARILSRCADKYLVFLIDDGRTLWVSNSFLAWGQSSFFNLPPMMELFIMASVSPLSLENRWSPTASEFLKSLSGKTVCGCVQDVMMSYRIILLDIPSVFKQMQEFGFARKIPSEEFQILVVNSLHSPRDSVSCARPDPALTNVQTEHASDFEKVNQYLYPELLLGTIEAVEVTQVINPLHIFCKLHVFSHELKKLSEQIQEYCESTSAAVASRPSDGSPCATKGSDGKWYRSILQQNVGFDVAKVFHVDYGIRDFVKVGDIRTLSAKFFRLPVVTYKCSLYGIKDKGFGWTTAQIERLKSVLLNQIFVGKFEYRNLSDGIYYVTLHGNDNVNINNSFAIQEKCLLAPDRAYFGSPSEIQSQETHKDEHRYATPGHSLGSCIVPRDLLPPENAKVCRLPRTELSTTGDSPAERIYRSLPTDLYPCKVESVLDEHLFTVGTVIEVNVSYVENDQRFWCQMAGSLLGLKMLMENIQRRYSCSQFQLPTGSICVAHHPDDGMWYRAQIVNHYLTPHVDVRLVDYGQLLKVPLQDLRPIEPQFLKLKCQAFQCSLFNRMHSGSCESTALSDSGLSDSFEFISPVSLCNVSLKCTVNAVMYDSQGAVLNMVDIESLAPNLCAAFVQKEANISAVESLEAPCVLNDIHALSTHSINVGAEEQVWITCVKGVNHFYGQIKQNTALVAKLNKDIQQYCAVAQRTRYSFSPQMMCVARYNDGQWYRGQIKAVKPKIMVHFVDYGDVVTLDESDVLPLPAQHSANMSIPFQAVQFRLFNITLQESSELNKWFETHATDCTFTATVMGKSPSGKLSVELHDGETNINLKVKEKYYGNESEVYPTSVKAVPTSLLEAPPQAFLCQLEGFKPTDGFWNDAAASRFSALVVDKLLTVSVQNVEMTSDVSNFPQYNVQVECNMGLINGLMKDYWIGCTTEVYGQIADEVSLKPMAVTLSGSRPLTQCFPKVTDLPPTAVEQDFVSEVYVSHINSTSSFFVQLAKDEKCLISLTGELNSTFLSVSDQIEINSVSHGSLVKAVFPDDDSWYRAVIKDTNGKDVHVEFIDFGNEAAVPAMNVCKLDEQFLKFPRFSIHCCLDAEDCVSIQMGTEQGTSPLINVLEKAGEKRLFCKFIKECRTVWEVKIADEKSTLDGSFKDLPLEQWDDLDISRLQNASPMQVLSEVKQIQTTDTFSLPFKRSEISVGQTVEVYASSIAGPDYFWCQHSNSEELDKISAIAQETGNSAQTDLIERDHLRPGDTCIARFTDEMWYRAQVIKKSPNTMYVLFVDFGNEFEVEADSIKPLPLRLRESPLQAFLCQLEGFSLSDGSWNDNATDKFCELIVDKPLKVTVKKIQNVLDSPSLSHHVRVHSKECIVNEQMKGFWSASAFAYDKSPGNPLLTANSVQLLSNGQPAPENIVDVISDNSLENIRTSDMKPQCDSPFGSEETFKQNEDLHEEPVKNEVEKAKC